MTDLALVVSTDADNPVEGDLRVSGVDFVVVSGIDATLQEVAVRLRWLRGEWFLDQREGVPYVGVVFRKGASLSLIRQVFRTEILRVPDVARVQRIEITRDPSSRRSTVLVEIVTRSGETGTVEV